MADETQISTPVDTSAVDTSSSVEPETSVVTDTSDTSAKEPATVEVTAETETNQANTLYAGKYKTVEDLVKGYEEAQKFVTKASEWESKYNDLLAKQADVTEKAQAQRLQEARTRGFNSVEEQQIAERVQLAEFEHFVNNLNQVPAEHLETVRQYLLQYYNTAHPDFLAEAKRYFPANFIEKAALDKSRLENQLMADFKSKLAQADEQRTAKLADELKTNFAEFLADVQTNEGKAKALKSFCDVGSINSKEDMQVFQDIYSQIAKYEREQAIKEYEAQKTIDETKSRATIQQGGNNFPRTTNVPTYSDIQKMTQEEYNKAVEQFGIETILQAK